VGVGTDGKVFIPRRDETRVDVYTDAGVHHSTLAHASLNGPDGIIATGTFGPPPAFTFDMIVPTAVTIKTGAIFGLTSINWAWVIATDDTVTESDLDALAFSTTIDDVLVTPKNTFLLNNGVFAPLESGDVAGRSLTAYQALLEAGEQLVSPTTPIVQFGFSFPESYLGSGTATTVMNGNCVASYNTTVDFVSGTSSPRLITDSAQRISVSCSAPPSAPILVPSGHSFSRILLVLILMLSPLLWWRTA
jgi:hypothetical protein